MIVLIPSYEPDRRLVQLVKDLSGIDDLEVLVVDDGSGPAYAPLFAEAERAGVEVLTHPENRGKGAALRTGFAHIRAHHPEQDVVCADSDGQHTLLDILRVAAALDSSDPDMVLGVRRFTGRVPLRSRFGNRVTAALFALATGVRITDTQTGLRGYPSAALPWLCGVAGDRFEYELNLLLRAREAGWTIDEVPIATIYLAGNESSHFRPLVDSLRIYLPLLAFSASSLVAFGVDFVTLLLLNALTGNLLAAVIGARGLSSAVNFLTNRRMVFGSQRPLRATLVRYYLLVAVLLLANYGLLAWLTGFGVALAVAKVLVEVTLFVASYQVQRSFVFGRPATSRIAPTEEGRQLVSSR